MTQEIVDITRKLQESLSRLENEGDHASLLWAHGFLTSLLTNLACRIPEVMNAKTPEQQAPAIDQDVQAQADKASPLSGVMATLKDVERVLAEIEQNRPSKNKQSRHSSDLGTLRGSRRADSTVDMHDSLERLLDDLEGSGPAEKIGVPANWKPSPKFRNGGVALPLPTDNEYRM